MFFFSILISFYQAVVERQEKHIWKTRFSQGCRRVAIIYPVEAPDVQTEATSSEFSFLLLTHFQNFASLMLPPLGLNED